MARIINGTLFVTSFNPTGNSGEYDFTNALFENQSDTFGQGALAVQPGFIVYAEATDSTGFFTVPGVAHRYKITNVFYSDNTSLTARMLWDEDGPEIDLPSSGTYAIITEDTPFHKFGLPVSNDVYKNVADGVVEAAYNADIRRITDKLGATGIPGVTGLKGSTGSTGVQGFQGVTGLANFWDEPNYPPIGVPPVLLWNQYNEALYVGITGVGHWVQVSAGSMIGATGVGYAGFTGVPGSTGLLGPTGISIVGETGIQGQTGTYGTTGIQGVEGQTGIQGSQGDTGVLGLTGLSGDTGIQGVEGQTGIQGSTGVQGIKGDTGIQGIEGQTGVQGQTGIRGLTGWVGSTGIQGLTGLIGSTGVQGQTGIRGLVGSTGIQGIQGSTGIQGQTGNIGITGLIGSTGIRGSTGIQGMTGVIGRTGIIGPVGNTGVQGQTGLRGLTGIPGPFGSTGVQGVTGLSQASFSTRTGQNVSVTSNIPNQQMGKSPSSNIYGYVVHDNGIPDDDSTKYNDFFKWDLSPLVSGVAVSEASFTFYTDLTSSDSSNVNIYRMLRQPDYVNATWNTYDGTNAWLNPGGDYDSTVLGTWSLADYPPGNHVVNLNLEGVNILQSMINGVTPNYGFINVGHGNNFTGRYKGFLNTDSSNRPKLTIKYAIGGTGSTGIQGTTGLFGFTGLRGFTGIPGSTGIQGPFGLQGQTGAPGLGVTGLQGPMGLPGVGQTGIQGVSGETGIQGIVGFQGDTGVQGDSILGPQGETGLQGIAGYQGETGVQGDSILGPQGVTGLQGIQGNDGQTGIQGVQGDIGFTGLQGITGLLGLQGDIGSTGLKGFDGQTGIQGSTGIEGLQGQTGVKSDTGLLNFSINDTTAIVPGIIGQTLLQDNMQFISWTLLTDVTSYISVDVQKSDYATYPNTQSILGSTGLSIDSDLKNTGNTSWWSGSTGAQGDILRAVLLSTDGSASKINLALRYSSF